MCGIVSIIPAKGKQVDVMMFKLLLLINEDRGKHSTGVYTVKGTVKRLGSATNFLENVAFGSKEKKTTRVYVPMIGHTRSPSVGANRGLESAQPVLINEGEDNEFAMVHNGTIYNMEDLAREDDIEFESDETDSQILAKYIENKNYSILSRYNGAASLIWTHKDEPKIVYVFRGESNTSEYTRVQTEERPLHYVKTDKGIIISSTEDSIKMVLNTEEERDSIEEIPENEVFRIENNELVSIAKISRSNQCQSKVYKTVKSKKKKHKHRYKDDDYYSQRYGYYEDEFYRENYVRSNVRKIHTYSLETDYTLDTAIEMIDEHDGKSLYEEKCNLTLIDTKEVFYYKGIYRIIGKILDGPEHIDKEGMRFLIESDTTEVVYFINGIKMRSEYAYRRCKSELRKLERSTLPWAQVISRFTDQPVPYLEGTGIPSESFIQNKTMDFTGTYKPEYKYRGTLEFFSGMFITSILHSIDDLTVGDTAEYKFLGRKVKGVITSINAGVRQIYVREANGSTIMIKDNEVLDFTKKEETTKEEKRKAISDMEDIIEETTQELETGFQSLQNCKIKVPKSGKNIVELLKETKKELKETA